MTHATQNDAGLRAQNTTGLLSLSLSLSLSTGLSLSLHLSLCLSPCLSLFQLPSPPSLTTCEIPPSFASPLPLPPIPLSGDSANALDQVQRGHKVTWLVCLPKGACERRAALYRGKSRQTESNGSRGGWWRGADFSPGGGQDLAEAGGRFRGGHADTQRQDEVVLGEYGRGGPELAGDCDLLGRG
jgi:hypothetical protein